jgi:hypothetical protein
MRKKIKKIKKIKIEALMRKIKTHLTHPLFKIKKKKRIIIYALCLWDAL